MLSPEMIRRAYDVLTNTQWPGRNTFEGQELLVALREEVFPQGDEMDMLECASCGHATHHVELLAGQCQPCLQENTE